MVSISLIKKRLFCLQEAHRKRLKVDIVNNLLSVEEKALAIVAYRCLRVSIFCSANTVYTYTEKVLIAL